MDEDAQMAGRIERIRLLQSYHEAGHVVATVALGSGFRPVRLGPTPEKPDEGAGHWPCTRTAWHTRSRHRLAPIAPLAGAIAEQRYAEDVGKERISSWWDEVQHRLPDVDRREAERLITVAYQPLSEYEAQLYLRALACRGRVLVGMWWRAITVLAEELFRNQKLSRRQVRKLLTPWPH